jgi:uncharacterized repeat protein (TIGR03803 family)
MASQNVPVKLSGDSRKNWSRHCLRNTLQHHNWISRMLLGAATGALAFAAALTSAVITTQSAEAQPFAVLHSFDNADGPQPQQSGLIQGLNGQLYGTTVGGGFNSQGSIFKMTPGGALTTVYSFCAAGTLGNCVDAYNPGQLVLGSNGSIYGTTEYGGAYNVGTVFIMSPSGEVRAPSNFCALATDPTGIEVNACGAFPVGALVQATSGIFWGVAQGGGALGQGVKFEMSPLGGFGSISGFACIEANCNGAVEVAAGLVQGTDGNFYGTSEEGGTGAFGSGQFAGSIFRITPRGSIKTIYSFCAQSDCTDGQAPTGVLVQGADGSFYGTTKFGGLGSECYNGRPGILGCGTVFQITPEGTLTTLYSFCTESGCPDGQNPIAGLILGSDGNFYGTTNNGGTAPSSACSDNPCGTIFQLTPSGTLTTLHSFCTKGEGCPSGGGPVGPLVQYTNGDFYGTTTFGGSTSSFNGTVFRLSAGLSPFVKTVPTSGLVGAEVLILGTDLTGATSVSFNGMAATFTVKSSTYITATVPAGATSGQVQVITPNGVLTSAVGFVVEP